MKDLNRHIEILNELQKSMRQAYVLIIFENCDFDYRDTLVRVSDLWKLAHEYPNLEKEVSAKVAST